MGISGPPGRDIKPSFLKIPILVLSTRLHQPYLPFTPRQLKAPRLGEDEGHRPCETMFKLLKALPWVGVAGQSEVSGLHFLAMGPWVSVSLSGRWRPCHGPCLTQGGEASTRSSPKQMPALEPCPPSLPPLFSLDRSELHKCVCCWLGRGSQMHLTTCVFSRGL